MATSDWLEQYKAGNHVQTWTAMTANESGWLRRLGEWDGAVAVARETMRRARTNVERLAEALPELGYEFAEPERVFLPAEGNAADQLDGLEAQIGIVPLSLRCWYEEVGSINLTGRHPYWNYDYADPLVVDAPLDYVISEYEEWEANREEEPEFGSFRLPFAPDYLHKANVSGGTPYELEVPNDRTDGLVLGEFHQTTFVNYLRICFRWGGFPGWERQDPEWARPPGPLPAEVRELASRLLPI